RPVWRALDFAWVQGIGTIRDRETTRFWKAQSDTARMKGVMLVAGMNLLNGGCGPARIQSSLVPSQRCPPGTVGVDKSGSYGVDGWRVNRWQMSGSEALAYGRTILDQPNVCAVLSWQWSLTWNVSNTTTWARDIRAWHTRTENKIAAKTLGTLAAAKPFATCSAPPKAVPVAVIVRPATRYVLNGGTTQFCAIVRMSDGDTVLARYNDVMPGCVEQLTAYKSGK
ncbi:MAG TPA: hypothetical protein VGR09_07195, partial [Gemmatimonadales bacterium]|nr:hypothetical protein [Gemmatimonadales bacterium]